MDTSANTDKESAKHDVCELCGKVKRSSSKNSIARFISSISACNCIKVSRVQSPDQAKGGKRKHSEPGTPGSYEPVIPEIDQYEILNFIGEGGMGSVYKVRDENIDSILAVKVLKQ